MNLDELLERATPSEAAKTPPVSAPKPYVQPSLSVEGSTEAPIVVVEAPAAVGKSTFARWLASTSRGHLVDLSQANVGGHGFRGELAAAGLLQAFEDGYVRVVVDALDEGLIRSGVANFLSYLEDLSEVVSRSAGRWPHGSIRLLLLGRTEASEIVRASLEDTHVPFTAAQLQYLDYERSKRLILALAQRSPQDTVAMEAVDAFFNAAAVALAVGLDDLWTDAVGRGFVGYPPVLELVATEVSDNPAAARAVWNRDKEWASAWELLLATAQGLLERERGKVVDHLTFDVDVAAYSPDHQLSLLAGELTRAPRDPRTGIHFTRDEDALAFREAVSGHINEHPFLAPGASDVFGSLVAARAIANGETLTGAESALSRYARLPFLWRFFVREAASEVRLVDGEGMGWVLASMWNGSQDVGWTRLIDCGTEDGEEALCLEIADGDPLTTTVVSDLTLRGVARQLQVLAPARSVHFATRRSADTDSAVFVLAGDVELDVAALASDGIDLLVEHGATVSIRSGQETPTLPTSLSIQREAQVRVSRTLYRYPWTQGGLLPDMRLSDATLEAEAFLQRIASVLPDGGRPAFLTGSGQPLGDDVNYVGWSRLNKRALGVVIRELQTAGVVTREAHSASGSTPMFQYRPHGFVWQDIADHKRRVLEPLSTVDWPSVWASVV